MAKVFSVKKSLTNAILAIVVAIAALVLGIIMIPNVTDFGLKILNIVIAIVVLIYTFGYLLPKVIKARGKIQILCIVEMVIMALIGLGLILSQFKVLNVSGACKIAGLAILLRGIIGTFTGYVRRSSVEGRKKYDTVFFCVYVGLIILGTYMFAKPFISDPTLVTIIAVFLILLAVCAIVYAILAWPAKKGGSSSSKKTNTSDKKVTTTTTTKTPDKKVTTTTTKTTTKK